MVVVIPAHSMQTVHNARQQIQNYAHHVLPVFIYRTETVLNVRHNVFYVKVPKCVNLVLMDII